MVEKLIKIYQPYIVKIPMALDELLIRHVELLDNKTSEFPHVHDSYEIYYVLRGNLEIQVSDQTVHVPEGHLLLLPPNTRHGTIYQPNVERKYFIMIFDLPKKITTPDDDWSKSEVVELQKLLNRLVLDKYYVVEDVHHCDSIVRKINDELRDRKFGWQSILKGHYLKFIILSFRNMIPSTYSDDNIDHQNINLAIEISKYMHANFHRDLTLKSVAEAMYVTPRHINRVFDACFGTTFSKTLSIFRLNYAKDYLYKTNYSVEKIANLVGFSSSRTLLKLFREIEGMTTTQYRRMIRKSMESK